MKAYFHNAMDSTLDYNPKAMEILNIAVKDPSIKSKKRQAYQRRINLKLTKNHLPKFLTGIEKFPQGFQTKFAE
jgi:hypothetical protein